MKKTLLVSQDSYLKIGIHSLLENTVKDNFIMTAENLSLVPDISNYDFIFVDVRHYLPGICFENLSTRKKSSTLFFMQTGRKIPDTTLFLRCYQDAIVVKRKMNLMNSRLLITSEISKKKEERNCLNNPCERCSYPYLTSAQLIILSGMKHGYTVEKIAAALNLSSKTIFSQMDRIRKKFSIETDLDLTFLMKNTLQCNCPIVAS